MRNMKLSDFVKFVKEESAGSRMFLTVTIPGYIDETAFKTMAFSKPPFVPPVLRSEENGEHILSYDVTADRFVRLSLPEITPVSFVTLMKNLTDIFAKCEDYFMNPLNFIVHEDYIYVNKQTFEVRLVYAPFEEPQCAESEMCENIFRIGRRIVKTDREWSLIGTHLFAMMEETSVCRVADAFGKLYEELYGEYAGIPPQEIPAGSEARSEDRQNRQAGPEIQTGLYTSTEPPAEPFAGTVAIPIPIDVLRGQANQANQEDFTTAPSPFPAPPIPDDMTDATGMIDATEMIDIDATALIQPPVGSSRGGLFQMSARLDYIGRPGKGLPEVIRIEPRNGSFSIGRIVKGGGPDCDYAFPANTEGVSKMHAQITVKDGKYYICDMNSTYGTFINKNRIPPQHPVELSEGCEVAFSIGAMYKFHMDMERGKW